MKREDVEKSRIWAIEDLFATDEEWERVYAETEKMTDFSEYEGKLGDKKTLLKFLKKTDEADAEISHLAIYANMRHDEDASVGKYISYSAKIDSLCAKYAASLSFYESEMCAQSDEYLDDVIADPAFSDYDYSIKRLKATKAHVLGADEEMIMALSSETLGSFYDIFGMLDNADLPLPEIEYKGKSVKLTHGLYGMLIKDPDRDVRREAYEKYYATYNSLINTITAVYAGNVKKDVFLSRVYKYDSCLSQALFREDVKPAVYENLLKSVEKGTPAMHRYVSDRKKILGYDRLYFYDMYVSLVEDAEISLPYDEAYALVVEGLGVLGKEYQGLLQKAHDERWIDVEETENKRSGAYSIGIKGYHPFVLLNYQPDTHDVFTIAHEMGHSLHTYFSSKNQPYAKADYKIFVAEVASTVNEVLLLKYLYAKTDDIALKKYLLNYYLETIRTTLFRQTMFAEFEYEAHGAVEKNEPLTKELLCGIYADLGKKYYGDAVEHDYDISIEWCRVPHFYRSFYVYKYATGIIAAMSIANRILTEGESAVKDYFAFLSSGSSSDPVSLLRLAGVDLETTAPFDFAMKEFEDTLKEFESLSDIK
ncbi:MAG: oligoendopeptidase F [Clostridia bacterium]|nr:oligoendopeptidase F [Clostridia bacterium]